MKAWAGPTRIEGLPGAHFGVFLAPDSGAWAGFLFFDGESARSPEGAVKVNLEGAGAQMATVLPGTWDVVSDTGARYQVFEIASEEPDPLPANPGAAPTVVNNVLAMGHVVASLPSVLAYEVWASAAKAVVEAAQGHVLGGRLEAIPTTRAEVIDFHNHLVYVLNRSFGEIDRKGGGLPESSSLRLANGIRDHAPLSLNTAGAEEFQLLTALDRLAVELGELATELQLLVDAGELTMLSEVGLVRFVIEPTLIQLSVEIAETTGEQRRSAARVANTVFKGAWKLAGHAKTADWLRRVLIELKDYL